MSRKTGSQNQKTHILLCLNFLKKSVEALHFPELGSIYDLLNAKQRKFDEKNGL